MKSEKHGTGSYNKSQRDAISQVYFAKGLYMFPTDLLSIIRSLNTVDTAIVICHASYVDHLLARSDDLVGMTNAYCCVYSVETPDDGQ
jgi:hypothetical protein